MGVQMVKDLPASLFDLVPAKWYKQLKELVQTGYATQGFEAYLDKVPEVKKAVQSVIDARRTGAGLGDISSRLFGSRD
jgi:hypothetical protein